jgi:hypothetical protein
MTMVIVPNSNPVRAVHVPGHQFSDIDDGKLIEGLPEAAACPFCGFHEWTGIVTVPEEMVDNIKCDATYHVQCDGCHAEGPGASTKLEAALRWNAAAERLPLRAPEGLRKALYLQQRKVWQAHAMVECVRDALYNHFGDWPANLPSWNLALDSVSEILDKAAVAIGDEQLLEDAQRIAKDIEDSAELTQEAA